jgi:amino acid adenylation domain-containing protein
MIEENKLPKAASVSAEELELLELLLEDEGFELSRPQPILASGARDDLPLSFAQQRLWFLDRLEPGSAAYNIPAAVRLTGRLDVKALGRTLSEITRRHEALRTVFVEEGGEARQVVQPHAALSLAVEDLSGLSLGEREAGLRARVAAEAARPFDLSLGPLLRSSLLRLGEEEHVLLLTMHHIVSDGWSAGVLVREMGELYGAYARGEESPLAELPIQYADYARWQREWLAGDVLEAQLAYWREQLAGAPPVLELPTDRPRPAVQSVRGARLPFTISRELSEQLRALAREEGATPFMVLLAAFGVLLSRYTGQEDIVVGTPVAGRNRTEVEGLIGFFVNTLAVRADLSGSPGFRELLGRVREACLGAYAHQEAPFEKLVEELRPERSLTHTPLFQVCFALQNASIPSLRLGDLTLKPLETEGVTAKFDLTLVLSERGGGLAGAFEYNTDLFDAATVGRMAGHFGRLLGAAVREPERAVAGLPMLGEEERRVLLRDWNRVEVDYSSPRCIHELFAAQVRLTPDATAVVYENEHLTYAELDARADRVARRLRRAGVGPESRVALLMERSNELVAAILGVLKAGGAYVPLDPAYPAERLRFMLEDCGARVALTHGGLGEALPEFVKVIEVEQLWAGGDEEEGEGDGQRAAAVPENAAYVIYTSGSTGRPKGVVVTHANVSRLLAATQHWYGFGPADVWTLFHSYAFDFSVWELWGALCYGGRLVVVPFWVSRSPEEFRRLLAEQKVTVLNQTPSAFRQLTAVESARRPGDGDELSLRWVIFGGEAFDARWAGDWLSRAGGPRLVNMYGITETTVHVTYRPVEERDAAAGAGGVIGQRIPDLQVYVLDERMEPAPLGVAGELYVGGAGLARGYLGRPGLTAERFVPHPFSAEPGARLYKTGDVGRYRADGELEYVGRADHQVKVRGHRIELGEIEAALCAHARVREAAVLLTGGGGEGRLAAYVVCEGGEAPRAAELREHLLERLPDYMVPSAFVALDKLPLTPNGKLDRKALPAPEAESGAAYVAPRTPAEEILCAIWAEVLGVERVGTGDNFFELGGDSIRSVRVLALAKEKGLQLSLQQLFRHQTVGGLAAGLAAGETGEAAPAATAPFSLISDADRAKLPAHVEDAYPLAKMQEGMLFHMELMPESPLYHNVNSWPLCARFDREALEAAVQKVVARHAILRTSFELSAYSEPLQLVYREAFLPVEAEDLRGLPAAEQERAVTAYVRAEKQRRFDMTRPPLLRFHVHRLTDEVFQFTLTEFHPILDGWSLQSTLTEIFTKYFALLDGRALADEPPPATTYRDFVSLERQTLDSPAAKEFWEERLRGCSPTPVPRWPASARGAAAVRVRRQRIRISPEVLDGLQRLARQAGVPLKSVLLAGHMKVMSLLGGRATALTGLVTNGRLEEAGGEQVRGLFLNTVPFRLDLARATWLELAQSAFAAERELLPFRRYPLAALQRKGEPLLETLFNYVHFHVLEGVLGAGRIETVEAADDHALEETNFTVDASFSLSPSASLLTLTLDCDATQLSDEQIDAIGGYYRGVFERMTADPASRHDARGLLGPAEQSLLDAWNDTARDYDLGRCVHELFEAQAARTPEAEAVVSEGERLTYRELNERANRLARHLRAGGVGPEVRVAVLLSQTPRVVVAALAVLKAGGAYVPLNAALPAPRLSLMLADSGAALLLTEGELAEALPECPARVISLDDDTEALGRLDAGNLPAAASPDNAAYVIYTSGSTGRPKGVVSAHAGLTNAYFAWEEAYDLRASVAAHLQAADFAFDVFTADLVRSLCSGAKLVMCPREWLLDAERLYRLLSRERVEYVDLVPAVMRNLVEYVEGRGLPLDFLRVVVVGSDTWRVGEFRRLRKLCGPRTRVVNSYGLTEATVDSTYLEAVGAEHPDGQPVPIGRPYANTKAYVLDESLARVPVGVAGELFISSVGLARGYLKRPALTAERFIPDPFAREPGARLYRTGDVARYLPGGVLEYLGRADFQVKVRGFRVEPGEVEALLSEHASVAEAAVVARADAAGEQQLVAYVAVSPGGESSAAELRAYLKRRLPEYMVPAAFVFLDQLPLSPNGKLDRRALPAPEGAETVAARDYLPPRTPLEELLCGVYAEVLGVERVGVEDDFFELGGHSLLATRAVSRLREALGVELPLRALFESGRVGELAARVEELRRGDASAVPPLARGEAGAGAPLSFAQQRLWFLDKLEPGAAAYNMPAAVRLTGRLNVEALARALSEVERRHEVLRTVFVEEGGEPRQVVREHAPLSLTVEDLSGLPVGEREAELRARIETEAARPFDLARGPVWRSSLLRLGEEEHVLLLTMHHIVSDGWSAGVLVREMGELYGAYARGEESPLAELPIQYADYARWQREWLAGDVLEAQLAYWREQLAGAPPVLELPTDRPRPSSPSYRGARERFAIDADVVDGLRTLAREEGATPFMVLLAAFYALLYRHTGQEDLVVGTPVAGRTRGEVEGLVGFFVNTLAVRAAVKGSGAFREVLRAVREACLGAYAHQEAPFEKLVEELRPERSLTHTPLFQVMFSYETEGGTGLRLPGLELEAVGAEGVTAMFDLSLNVREAGGRLEASIEYRTELFDAATARRMAGHFRRLLAGVVREPDRAVAELPMLGEEERRRQLVGWNETARDYPAHLGVHELFERQAARTPDAVAVRHGAERLTYAELNARANRLARRLRELGAGPEKLVGLCVERSTWMLVGLLATLKAGAAYLPLDPAYPAERLEYMIRDAGLELLLTRPGRVAHLPAGGPLQVDLESAAAPTRGHEAENLSLPVAPEGAAYVIYTSGSTGAPKGVLIRQRALSNYTQYFVEWAGLKPSDKVLQFASISFDTAAEEIFPCLSAGATLVLRDEDMLDSTQKFLERVADYGVTVLDLPTAYWHHLTLDLSGQDLALPEALRLVVIGGEEALPERLAEWRKAVGARVRLTNGYGPTETTIVATLQDLTAAPEDEGEPPRPYIGKPVANAQTYVLDAHLMPVPVGVVGELYVGGDGLARGYLNRPALTAEKFIPNPFARRPGARLYRTGDVVKYRDDGVLEYVGRADHQVKIRGFRVELGEIEAALASHPSVRVAAVVAREEAKGEKRLVAYVAAHAGAEPTAAALREHLLGRLPVYMVPAAFVVLDVLPLTTSGKLDRRALPAPEGAETVAARDYLPPRTPLEELLCGVYAEVLGVERVGVEDDFFELGGHSLLATRAVSRLREALGVELPLRALFESGRVGELAARVEELRRGDASAVPPLARGEAGAGAPLSFAQQRLWFLDKLEPGAAAYNMPAAVRLTGRLNVEALARALSEVERRHEVLRTVFVEEGGEPRQVVREHAPLSLTVEDLSGLPVGEREAELRARIETEAARPFDLARGPVWRSSLLRLGEEEHVLLLTMHHIVSDGWSIGVLVREVGEFYEAFLRGEDSPLAELPVQYADYARWQREWLQGEVLDEQLSYWRAQLAGAPPVLELPTDRPRPAVQTFRGALESFVIDSDTAEGLRAVARREGATPFMVLLAAFGVLLSRYTGQEDIVVGTPVAGRNRTEVEGLIGFFVNTLAVRADLSGSPGFRELLGRVREACLGAYAHQEAPFEKLVEELRPERSLTHTPLFQVMFSYETEGGTGLRLPGLELEAVGAEGVTAKFDLTLVLSERGGGLAGAFEYNTDLFDAATVGRMAGHFGRLLGAAVREPERAVAGLPMLGEEERRVLDGWNDTAREYTGPECIHELFEQQAARTPEAVAVRRGAERLTYAELNERADRVARRLRAEGVGPESRVAILVERTTSMVAAMLGILKAGGAYVPLDPAYPAERLAFMLEDSGARVALTQDGMAEVLPEGVGDGLRVVNIEEVWAGADEAEVPGASAGPDNLAYVIYTSGSTGRPKGVAITHRSGAAFIRWSLATFDPRDLAGVLASTSICFDLSVFELFVPLACGARVVLADDALALPTLEGREEVTLVNTVPSAMAALAEYGSVPAGVRAVNLAGEALKRELVERVYGLGVGRVLNLYGPSEDTTYSTWTVVERGGGTVTIGRPVENTRVYILNERMALAPVGVAGELYLAGAGLARGYLNRPALTAERFVPDPFSPEPGGRLYRTGDLARWTASGELEYLGRIDHQVKIRGFRIELGEIEAALVQHEAVREAVVTAGGRARGEPQLVAYIVPRGARHASQPKELREHLRARLPEYMVPSVFVLLDALPLTPNGKVDRKALPAPEGADAAPSSAYVAPRTAAEEVLAEIWAGVLGLERVGTGDNFFELGGHSLLATQVVSRVREALQCELPLRKLFETPTVAGLVEHLAQQLGGAEVVEEIARTFNELKHLSEEEVRMLLAEQMGEQAD